MGFVELGGGSWHRSAEPQKHSEHLVGLHVLTHTQQTSVASAPNRCELQLFVYWVELDLVGLDIGCVTVTVLMKTAATPRIHSIKGRVTHNEISFFF